MCKECAVIRKGAGNMEEKRETFTYTYSSTQQNEIKSIREKYIPPTQEQDKMEQLRRLDASVTKSGNCDRRFWDIRNLCRLSFICADYSKKAQKNCARNYAVVG